VLRAAFPAGVAARISHSGPGAGGDKPRPYGTPIRSNSARADESRAKATEIELIK